MSHYAREWQVILENIVCFVEWWDGQYETLYIAITKYMDTLKKDNWL